MLTESVKRKPLDGYKDTEFAPDKVETGRLKAVALLFTSVAFAAGVAFLSWRVMDDRIVEASPEAQQARSVSLTGGSIADFSPLSEKELNGALDEAQTMMGWQRGVHLYLNDDSSMKLVRTDPARFGLANNPVTHDRLVDQLSQNGIFSWYDQGACHVALDKQLMARGGSAPVLMGGLRGATGGLLVASGAKSLQTMLNEAFFGCQLATHQTSPIEAEYVARMAQVKGDLPSGMDLSHGVSGDYYQAYRKAYTEVLTLIAEMRAAKAIEGKLDEWIAVKQARMMFEHRGDENTINVLKALYNPEAQWQLANTQANNLDWTVARFVAQHMPMFEAFQFQVEGAQVMGRSIEQRNSGFLTYLIGQLSEEKPLYLESAGAFGNIMSPELLALTR